MDIFSGSRNREEERGCRMYCIKCGKEIPNDADFCCYCGKQQNEKNSRTASDEIVVHIRVNDRRYQFIAMSKDEGIMLELYTEFQRNYDMKAIFDTHVISTMSDTDNYWCLYTEFPEYYNRLSNRIAAYKFRRDDSLLKVQAFFRKHFLERGFKQSVDFNNITTYRKLL